MISYERELDTDNKLNSYWKIIGILNNVDIGKKKPSSTTKIIYYLLLKTTSFDPAMGLSSGDEQELEK
jgi:hypothetical protein